MALTVQIFQRFDAAFRQVQVEPSTTAVGLVRTCAERMQIAPLYYAFAVFECVQRGNSVAERRIGDNEIVAAVMQRWQRDGMRPPQARFVIDLDPRVTACLMARATVLQGADFVSAYPPIVQPPDIRGLLNALTYYYPVLDAVSAEELLLQAPNGAFLVRNSAEPDAIVVSYVHQYAVYNVDVYFDIRGFYVDPNSQQRYLTVEDTLQYLASIQHPMRAAFTLDQAAPMYLLAAQIRTYDSFYFEIAASNAEEILRGQRIGTFVIRPSSREGNFATSYVTDGGVVRHSLVAYANQGLSTPGDGRYYSSLDRFVAASRVMNLGLRRCMTPVDDQLLVALGIREAHRNEFANTVILGMRNWH